MRGLLLAATAATVVLAAEREPRLAVEKPPGHTRRGNRHGVFLRIPGPLLIRAGASGAWCRAWAGVYRSF